MELKKIMGSKPPKKKKQQNKITTKKQIKLHFIVNFIVVKPTFASLFLVFSAITNCHADITMAIMTHRRIPHTFRWIMRKKGLMMFPTFRATVPLISPPHLSSSTVRNFGVFANKFSITRKALRSFSNCSTGVALLWTIP